MLTFVRYTDHIFLQEANLGYLQDVTDNRLASQVAMFIREAL